MADLRKSTFSGSNSNSKAIARIETIIKPYQEIFGLDKIPNNKQYWSLCGLHVDKNGDIPSGAESKQLFDNGLIDWDQFNGIDRDPDIIDANRKSIPQSHWYNGDFYDILRDEHYKKNNFNPAIIYADFISMKKIGVNLTTEIMSLVSLSNKNGVLLVSNIMINNPRENGGLNYYKMLNDDDFRDESVSRIRDEFYNHEDMPYLITDGGWKHWRFQGDKAYSYTGVSEHSRTMMGTIVFYRK